jgi:hypothetical protein
VYLFNKGRTAGYPTWCCNWVRSYLADRSAFFFFDNYKSLRFDISAGVPQESSLSPILFLSYIATFYKNLQAAHPRLFIVGFADDTNLIIVNRTFEENRDQLENTWEICTECLRQYGMEFAPAKNELLHFSRARDACTLLVRLGSNTIHPAEFARFLEVWLDIRLNWKAYVNKIKAKMNIQTLVFLKLAAFA